MLIAEGITCSKGYGPQYFDGLIEEAISSRGYKRLFSEQRLNRYRDELHHLPDNGQLTREASEDGYQDMVELLLNDKRVWITLSQNLRQDYSAMIKKD